MKCLLRLKWVNFSVYVIRLSYCINSCYLSFVLTHWPLWPKNFNNELSSFSSANLVNLASDISGNVAWLLLVGRKSSTAFIWLLFCYMKKFDHDHFNAHNIILFGCQIACLINCITWESFTHFMRHYGLIEVGFSHLLQGYLSGTGANEWLSQCQ